MTPKQLTYILAGIITLIVLAGAMAYWMSHQALARKSDELAKTMADISLVSQQLSSYTILSRDYEEVLPLRDKVYGVLPTEKQQSEVTLQLNAIVNSVGLTLSGLNFQSTAGRPGAISQTTAAEIPGVLVMPVRFQITSSYDDFLELLQKLENQQRYMQVSNLSINRSGSQLQFNIDLEVFLMP